MTVNSTSRPDMIDVISLHSPSSGYIARMDKLCVQFLSLPFLFTPLWPEKSWKFATTYKDGSTANHIR